MPKIIITIDIPDGATVGTSTTTSAASETRQATAPSDTGQGNQADPWGSSGGSSQASSDPGNVKVVDTKNGKQTWTFNAPNAPLCHCDITAAHVEGNKAKGGTWKAWRCSKGAGDNWKDKCDFSEWA